MGGFPAASGGSPPYSYQWAPTAGLSDSVIPNPVAKPSTTQTYYLIVRDASGCISTDSVKVTVTSPVVPVINGLQSKYCLDAGNVIMTGLPSGGQFSGTGVSGNVFQPHIAGIGKWCITYSYTNPATGCGNDTVICVTVDSLPLITIDGYRSSYCMNDSSSHLVATPAGGIFSGPGVSGNTFNPGLAGVGNKVVTYTYSDTTSGCSNTLQVVITVKGVPALSLLASLDTACSHEPVTITPTYSPDVFNIVWSAQGSGNFYSGLNAVTVSPTGSDYCVTAQAIGTPSGCSVTDTLCITVRPDCNVKAVDEQCSADSTYINTAITINVLGNDTLPVANDTVVSLTSLPANGKAVVNTNRTVTYTPNTAFSGEEEFIYMVCAVFNNYQVCDTASICVTIVDTTIACFIPNGFSPNGDGVHDTYEIPCNDEFPNAELRVFDRWGLEVWRSDGHYHNDWSGYNKQGDKLPDATYYIIYFYNDGAHKSVATYVTLMR